MKLSELLNENLLHCKIAAGSKEELLEKMASAMHDIGYVKKDYIRGVVLREEADPTGLQLEGYGCAIPHSEMELVNRPVISIATLTEPVEFQQMANAAQTVKVDLVFMLAVSEGIKQVNVLQKLMTLMQSKEVINELLTAKNSKEIFEVMDNYEKEPV